MSFVATVLSVLQGFTALQALVANGTSPETYRIFNKVAPQGSTKPTVVYQKVAGNLLQTLNNNDGLGMTNHRLRVSVSSDVLDEIAPVVREVKRAMMGATAFKAIAVFEFDTFDAETQDHQTIVDFSVWYNEV